MPRRQHLKVRTTDVLKTPDMVRYISYASYGTTPGGSTDYNLANLVFTPESAEPIRETWGGRTKATVHRFQDGQFTYFRLPSAYNTNWVSMGIARWRSFGVNAEMEMR
jgi:hypothetical protein